MNGDVVKACKYVLARGRPNGSSIGLALHYALSQALDLQELEGTTMTSIGLATVTCICIYHTHI